jgi:hypothetical protein
MRVKFTLLPSCLQTSSHSIEMWVTSEGTWLLWRREILLSLTGIDSFVVRTINEKTVINYHSTNISDGKRPFGRARHECDDIIKLNLRLIQMGDISIHTFILPTIVHNFYAGTFLLNLSAVTSSHPHGANIKQSTQHAVCHRMASHTSSRVITHANGRVLTGLTL